MTAPQGEGATQIGFPETDELLRGIRDIGKVVQAQAKSLSGLSRAVLQATGSPVVGTSLEERWPLASVDSLQELLFTRAAIDLIGEVDPTASDDDGQPPLDRLAIYEGAFWESDFIGIHTDRLSWGYPPTGLSRDLIKWADELSRNDWSVLARIDKATERRDQVAVSVYPETDATRRLLDEQTRIEERYTASQWLSERVIMHAYEDEFDRFDWVGSDSAL